MVCVHPTVTHNRSALMRLELATGLKVKLGNSYLRLVNPDGTTPKCKRELPTRRTRFVSDFNGGGDAA